MINLFLSCLYDCCSFVMYVVGLAGNEICQTSFSTRNLFPATPCLHDCLILLHGVPDEFKARNQIAGGWTHAIPLMDTIIESSKNFTWINYIFYKS